MLELPQCLPSNLSGVVFCVFCGHNKKLVQSMSHFPDNKFRTFDRLHLQFSLHCFQRRNRPLERHVHPFTSSKCASAIGFCFEFNGLFWISVVWVYYHSILFFEFNGLFCVSILLIMTKLMVVSLDFIVWFVHIV